MVNNHLLCGSVLQGASPLGVARLDVEGDSPLEEALELVIVARLELNRS